MSLLCVAGTHNLASRATYHRELSLEFLRDSGHNFEQDMTRFPPCPRTCFAHPTLSHLLRRASSKELLKQLRHRKFYHLHDIIVPRRHLKKLSNIQTVFLLRWHLVASQNPPNFFCSVEDTRHMSRIRSASYYEGFCKTCTHALVQSLMTSVWYPTLT